MLAVADAFDFAPPPPRRSLGALAMAIVAHLLLLGALAWGVSWKQQPVTLSAEAELWAAVPVQAAPKLVEVPPPPPEQAATAKVVQPPPPPVPDIAPKVTDADIALERDKQRLAKEKLLKAQKQAQLDKLEKLAIEKKRLDDKRELEKKMAADKKKADLKQAELKLAEQKQAALAASKKDALRAQEDAKKMEAQRQENIKRMAGLAGATGSANSTGTTQKASGPTASYAGKVNARVRPKIVFTEEIAGNPTADIEVRTSPDGTITSRKLVKSSGVPAWDEAVLKAIDKTEAMPRDVDGTVPSPLIIGFSPKDR